MQHLPIDGFGAIKCFLEKQEFLYLLSCSKAINRSAKAVLVWTLRISTQYDAFVRFVKENPTVTNIKWRLTNRRPPEVVRDRVNTLWVSPCDDHSDSPLEGKSLQTVVAVGFGSEERIRGDVPMGVKRLRADDVFPFCVRKKTLPPSLVAVDFGMGSSDKIHPNLIPHGVKCVEFGDRQPGVLETVLPDSVTRLSMGYYFREDLQNRKVPWLPPYLEVLRLRKRFRGQLNVAELPPTLRVIQIADNFFTSIESVDFSTKDMQEMDIKLSHDPVIHPALLNQNNSQAIAIFPGYKGPDGNQSSTFGYATDVYI